MGLAGSTGDRWGRRGDRVDMTVRVKCWWVNMTALTGPTVLAGQHDSVDRADSVGGVEGVSGVSRVGGVDSVGGVDKGRQGRQG